MSPKRGTVTGELSRQQRDLLLTMLVASTLEPLKIRKTKRGNAPDPEFRARMGGLGHRRPFHRVGQTQEENVTAKRKNGERHRMT